MVNYNMLKPYDNEDEWREVASLTFTAPSGIIKQWFHTFGTIYSDTIRMVVGYDRYHIMVAVKYYPPGHVNTLPPEPVVSPIPSGI